MWWHRRASLKSPVSSPGERCITKEAGDTDAGPQEASLGPTEAAQHAPGVRTLWGWGAGKLGLGSHSGHMMATVKKSYSFFKKFLSKFIGVTLHKKRAIFRLTSKDQTLRRDWKQRWGRSLIFLKGYLDISNDFRSPGPEHWKLLQMRLNCLLCVCGAAQGHLKATVEPS